MPSSIHRPPLRRAARVRGDHPAPGDRGFESRSLQRRDRRSQTWSGPAKQIVETIERDRKPSSSQHTSGMRCPISRSLTTSCVCPGEQHFHEFSGLDLQSGGKRTPDINRLYAGLQTGRPASTAPVRVCPARYEVLPQRRKRWQTTAPSSIHRPRRRGRTSHPTRRTSRCTTRPSRSRNRKPRRNSRPLRWRGRL
jgi:hypothetical protein